MTGGQPFGGLFEQQQLGIAGQGAGDRQHLLPTVVVETLRDKIGELKQQGLTILLAEQHVHFALAFADRVYVLEKGSITFSGPAAELRCDRVLRNHPLAL